MQSRAIAVNTIQVFLVDFCKPTWCFDIPSVYSPIDVECILVEVDELLNLKLIFARYLIRDNQANCLLKAFFIHWFTRLPTNFIQFEEIEFVSDKTTIHFDHVVVILLYQIPLDPSFNIKL